MLLLRRLLYSDAVLLLPLLAVLPRAGAQVSGACPCRINNQCASVEQCQEVGIIAGSVIGAALVCVLLALLTSHYFIGRVMRRKCCVCVSRTGFRNVITGRWWLISPSGICAERAEAGDEYGPCCVPATPTCSPSGAQEVLPSAVSSYGAAKESQEAHSASAPSMAPPTFSQQHNNDGDEELALTRAASAPALPLVVEHTRMLPLSGGL